MTDKDFVNKILERVGGPSAIGMIGDAERLTLLSLLVDKGVFTREEFNEYLSKEFVRLSDQIMRMPIPSPIQVPSNQ